MLEILLILSYTGLLKMDFPFDGDGQQSVTSGRTTLTVASGANLKGPWVEILSLVPFNARGILVHAHLFTTTNRTILLDIGIGASGSEIPLINNIFTSIGGNATCQNFYFPIEIPQNTRISGRFQANNTSITRAFSVTLFSCGFLPSVGHNRIITMGADTTDSGGTAVASGASNSKGSWTQITAGVNRDIHELWIATGHSGGDFTIGTTSRYFIDVGIGPAGAERIIIPNILQVLTTNGEGHISHGSFMYPVHIPANTRIAIRSQSGVADPENIDIVLYGV